MVRLVILSGPCVKFSVMSESKPRKRLRPEMVREEATPLQTQYHGSHNMTSPGSPTSRGLHPPGYQQNLCDAVIDSPSQLPMGVMNLNCMPPPPYTPEVPLRHRVLARGEEGNKEIDGQAQQCIDFIQEPQITQDQQVPLDIQHQQEPLGVLRQQIQNASTQQEEVIDTNESSFNGNKETVPQESGIMENDDAPAQIFILEEFDVPSMEREALINDSQGEMSTRLVPPPPLPPPLESDDGSPSASPSSVPGSGRESFLSQIRQFDKTSLKKPDVNPEVTNCNQLQRISFKSNPGLDDMRQMTKEKKNSPQGNGALEKGDSMDLLSALRQAMKHRAKVLHDTLMDEGNESDDDDNDNLDNTNNDNGSENEWEL